MTATPVLHGTAETLARVHHMRQLTDALPDAHELDPVIRFLLGPVGDAALVVEQIADELDQLWSLVTEDWSESDLDEIPEEDWTRYSFSSREQETAHQWGLTVNRLQYGIEAHVALHRLIHAETSGSRQVAA